MLKLPEHINQFQNTPRLYGDLEDKLNQCIKNLNLTERHRGEKQLKEIKNFLKEMIPFITLLDIDNKISQNTFLLELSKQLKHKKYNKGRIIKRAGEYDNLFFIILNGKVVELGVEFQQLNLTKSEFSHFLRKLYSVQEFFLYNKSISLNQNSFPFMEFSDVQKNQYLQEENNEEKTFEFSSEKHYFQVTSAEKENKILFGVTNEFSFTIPHYFIKKVHCRGECSGSLSHRKKYRQFSTFLTLEITDIAFIDKEKLTNKEIYNLKTEMNISHISEISNSFFLFHNVEKGKLERLFPKLFIYKKLTKGDFLIKQNTIHEGVFLIKSGIFSIDSERSFLELNKLIANIKQSLVFYSKFIPSLKFYPEQNYKIDNYIIDPIYQTKEFQNYSKIKRHISFGEVKSRQIIGLNEYYHHKIEINYFNVKCISTEAEVYFLPKELFLDLLNADCSFLEKIISLINRHIIQFVLTIKRFKEQFISQIVNAKNSGLKKKNSDSSLDMNKNKIIGSKYFINSEKKGNNKQLIKSISGFYITSKNMNFKKSFDNSFKTMHKTKSGKSLSLIKSISSFNFPVLQSSSSKRYNLTNLRKFSNNKNWNIS